MSYRFNLQQALILTMRKLIITLNLCFACLWGYSQNKIEFTRFLKDMQLLPRDPITNKAYYTLKGKVPKSMGFSTLLVKIFKADVLVKEISYPLSTNQDSMTFSIPIEINAELSNHLIAMFGLKNNEPVFIRKAEKVVAGDVLVVNGQSNNIGSVQETDYDPFMRSYTDLFGWNDILYTQPSQWAPRIAKNIIVNQKIPVAIFNESYGGVVLNYFLKNENNQDASNYGDLMKRLEAAEVKTNIRAILWWQGESDGWETPSEDYKQQFKKLAADWKKDYNDPNCYLFQIRFRSCTHINPEIMEVQRQLSNEIEGLKIMSTNAALSDSCHFHYSNGYDSLGNRMYRLLSSDLYGTSPVNTRPPDVDKVWFSAAKELTIQLKNVVGDLKTIGKPWADFRLEGKNATLLDSLTKIIGGKVLGDKIILEFTGDTNTIKAVSYLSHIDSSNNWIVNPLGVGILSFYDVPIGPKPFVSSLHTEGVSTFEISPSITNNSIKLTWEATDFNKKTVTIYNLLGLPVWTANISHQDNSLFIDVSHFNAGQYLVVFQAVGKRASVRKMVKF